MLHYLFVQGAKSDRFTRKALDEQIAAMDEELGDTAVRVRVPQGHEPRHLLKLFKGRETDIN